MHCRFKGQGHFRKFPTCGRPSLEANLQLFPFPASALETIWKPVEIIKETISLERKHILHNITDHFFRIYTYTQYFYASIFFSLAVNPKKKFKMASGLPKTSQWKSNILSCSVHSKVSTLTKSLIGVNKHISFFWKYLNTTRLNKIEYKHTELGRTCCHNRHKAIRGGREKEERACCFCGVLLHRVYFYRALTVYQCVFQQKAPELGHVLTCGKTKGILNSLYLIHCIYPKSKIFFIKKKPQKSVHIAQPPLQYLIISNRSSGASHS